MGAGMAPDGVVEVKPLRTGAGVSCSSSVRGQVQCQVSIPKPHPAVTRCGTTSQGRDQAQKPPPMRKARKPKWASIATFATSR